MFKIANIRTFALGLALAGSIGAAANASAYDRPVGYAAGSTGYAGSASAIAAAKSAEGHGSDEARVIITASRNADRPASYAAGSTGFVARPVVPQSATPRAPDAPRQYAVGSTGVVLYPAGTTAADASPAGLAQP